MEASKDIMALHSKFAAVLDRMTSYLKAHHGLQDLDNVMIVIPDMIELGDRTTFIAYAAIPDGESYTVVSDACLNISPLLFCSFTISSQRIGADGVRGVGDIIDRLDSSYQWDFKKIMLNDQPYFRFFPAEYSLGDHLGDLLTLENIQHAGPMSRATNRHEHVCRVVIDESISKWTKKTGNYLMIQAPEEDDDNAILYRWFPTSRDEMIHGIRSKHDGLYRFGRLDSGDPRAQDILDILTSRHRVMFGKMRSSNEVFIFGGVEAFISGQLSEFIIPAWLVKQIREDRQ